MRSRRWKDEPAAAAQQGMCLAIRPVSHRKVKHSSDSSPVDAAANLASAHGRASMQQFPSSPRALEDRVDVHDGAAAGGLIS
jgi:hypothetical protein